MIKNILKTNTGKNIMISLIGFLAILSSVFVNPINHYIAGFIMIIMAVVLYFFMVILVAEKNWLDIRAVFTGIWLFTIGLASLRLTNYQEQWLAKTWILLAVAYVMFQFGSALGIKNGSKLITILRKCLTYITPKKIRWELKEERFFLICIITTIIGIGCFIVNVLIKGYIPAFSNNLYAYVDFYTKFHLFSVAATSVSGLCYYCIKMQNLGKWKKIILWICIFYLVVLFPVLVVSRGVFIVAAISLTTTIFYLNGKKLYVFIVCLIAMASIYLFTSNLRGYTEEQLGNLFEPTNIVVEENSTDETLEEDEVNETVSFSLSPKAAFLYGYLTVSHDNFNEAVQNAQGFTWGARQFYPFNVLLRIQAVWDMIDQGEFYKVRPYLNTVNMVGLFYYDFHEWGVVICTFLWALLFGLVQGFYMKSRGMFSLFVHGFSMNVVMLCFFSSWVDSFELWMFCGVIMIIAGISCLRYKME